MAELACHLGHALKRAQGSSRQRSCSLCSCGPSEAAPLWYCADCEGYVCFSCACSKRKGSDSLDPHSLVAPRSNVFAPGSTGVSWARPLRGGWRGRPSSSGVTAYEAHGETCGLPPLPPSSAGVAVAPAAPSSRENIASRESDVGWLPRAHVQASTLRPPRTRSLSLSRSCIAVQDDRPRSCSISSRQQEVGGAALRRHSAGAKIKRVIFCLEAEWNYFEEDEPIKPPFQKMRQPLRGDAQVIPPRGRILLRDGSLPDGTTRSPQGTRAIEQPTLSWRAASPAPSRSARMPRTPSRSPTPLPARTAPSQATSKQRVAMGLPESRSLEAVCHEAVCQEAVRQDGVSSRRPKILRQEAVATPFRTRSLKAVCQEARASRVPIGVY